MDAVDCVRERTYRRGCEVNACRCVHVQIKYETGTLVFFVHRFRTITGRVEDPIRMLNMEHIITKVMHSATLCA